MTEVEKLCEKIFLFDWHDRDSCLELKQELIENREEEENPDYILAIDDNIREEINIRNKFIDSIIDCIDKLYNRVEPNIINIEKHEDIDNPVN